MFTYYNYQVIANVTSIYCVGRLFDIFSFSVIESDEAQSSLRAKTEPGSLVSNRHHVAQYRQSELSIRRLLSTSGRPL